MRACMQGIKYDEDAQLVSAWVPELSRCSAEHKHMPWTMSPEQAAQCLDQPYYEPMVDPASQTGKPPKDKSTGAAPAVERRRGTRKKGQ